MLIVGAPVWAEDGHDHGAHDLAHGAGMQQVTIKGELVDSLCYVGMAAKGAGHKQCAIDCAKAGIPISIVEDGTGKLYTVLPKEDKTGYPANVIAKMGDKVTLTGDLYENGGQRYVTVESVE
jgi:hypothetical protein